MCTTVHQIEKKKKNQYLFQYSTKVNKNSINQPNYEPINAGHVCHIQELNSADIYIISTSEKFQVKTILNNSQQTPYKLKAQKTTNVLPNCKIHHVTAKTASTMRKTCTNQLLIIKKKKLMQGY